MGNPTIPTMKDTQEQVSVKDSEMKTKEKVEKAGEKLVPAPSTPDSPTLKHGRWSTAEKLLFLHGLKLFGRGRWKKISTFLPLRSLVQIKSHGQKVLKRADAGEDIWAPLREKEAFLQQLLAKQAESPDFILPRIPTKASIARPLPKPKLKPRTTLAFEERATEGVHFSIGNGRRENEPGTAVLKTNIGSASNLSFSFRDAPQQVEDEESNASHCNFGASECRTPQRPDPHMIKSTAVLAATALCQLSVGWEDKKSSSDDDDDTHHVNIVSP